MHTASEPERIIVVSTRGAKKKIIQKAIDINVFFFSTICPSFRQPKIVISVADNFAFRKQIIFLHLPDI